jgi:hypothetical protein
MNMLRKSVLLTSLVTAAAATSVVALPVQAQEINTGNVVGGIAGALLGSNVGRGNGKLAATAAGGIVGALVGGNIERSSNYYGGAAPQPAYAPQQRYTSTYVQPAPQYQQHYDTVTYTQPGYVQETYVQPAYVQETYSPVYTQPSYAYVQPQSTIVYSQSYYRGDRGYGERHEYRDRRDDWRGYEHRDHDRDHYRHDHDR